MFTHSSAVRALTIGLSARGRHAMPQMVQKRSGDSSKAVVGSTGSSMTGKNGWQRWKNLHIMSIMPLDLALDNPLLEA